MLCSSFPDTEISHTIKGGTSLNGFYRPIFFLDYLHIYNRNTLLSHFKFIKIINFVYVLKMLGNKII